MKIHLLFATAVAAAFVVSSSDVLAQGAGQAPAAAPARPKFGVAVIDIGRIFKEHVRFKQTMDQLKAQVQSAEDGLKKERDEITNLMEQQKAMQPGSPDYKKFDDLILKRQADFNLEAAKRKKDLVDQQDQLYFNVYTEVNQVVKMYCDHYGINLVLRYSDDKIDPNEQQSVLRGINRPIVYIAPDMDITKVILDHLNQGAAPAATTATRPTGIARPPVQRN